MSNIKIWALGGLDESGKNIYCVDYNNKIFIFDCGIKRPEASQFGVDYIVPDFTYLVENKNRIKGLIITHLHDDVMFAVASLIKDINIDIYTTRFLKLFLESKLKDVSTSNCIIHEVERDGTFKIDGETFNTFGLTHSNFDAFGVTLETEYGQIVIAQQYVIDFDERDSRNSCDISRIAEIGKKGVFCALIESSYSDIEGYTAPRHRIYNSIKSAFVDNFGRILITLYQQNFFRLDEILCLAHEQKRKVYIYDDNLRETLKLAVENNYYRVPDGLIISDKEFNNDLENVVILVSEDGATVFKKMHKIAIGEDKLIELKDDDTVIIASPVVSGSEKEASSMENELYKDGVKIVKLNRKVTLSLHPASEDIKLMLYLLKPKYFLPIMGYYRDFINAANIAVNINMTPDKIIILDNGQIAYFENGKLKSTSMMIESIGENMIGNADKDIASYILKDREALASDGVIVIGIAIDYNTKEIIGGPDIQSRGVIYVKDSEYLIKNIASIITEEIENRVAEGNFNNMDTRAEVRNKVAKYIQRETGKHPMILPAIIEINLS